MARQQQPAGDQPAPEAGDQQQDQQPAADAAPEQQQDTSTARRLRQSLAELASLRRQVEAMPALEELESLKTRAARFDELQGVLPELKQQISQAAQAGRAEVDQQLQAERAALQSAQEDVALLRAFMKGGGLDEGETAFLQLMRAGGHLHRQEDGSLAVKVGEEVMGLADGIQQLANNSPVFGALFRPTAGSGSGTQSSRKVPQVAPDLSRMSKAALRSLAWN